MRSKSHDSFIFQNSFNKNTRCEQNSHGEIDCWHQQLTNPSHGENVFIVHRVGFCTGGKSFVEEFDRYMQSSSPLPPSMLSSKSQSPSQRVGDLFPSVNWWCKLTTMVGEQLPWTRTSLIQRRTWISFFLCLISFLSCWDRPTGVLMIVVVYSIVA